MTRIGCPVAAIQWRSGGDPDRLPGYVPRIVVWFCVLVPCPGPVSLVCVSGLCLWSVSLVCVSGTEI